MSDPGEELAEWRSKVLDAHLLRRPVLPPPGLRDACAAWLGEAVPADGRPPLGLDPGDLPDAWVGTLAWCGVPIAPAGELRWGRDLVEDSVPVPTLRDGVLHLPSPEALALLTSLALKPLRVFVAERLRCRLQAAPGIRLWLWPGQAALMSLSPMPLAGFLYGSSEGHRASIALQPWGGQVVTW